MVEFSLVSLLLMTMAAGVVDLGRGVYSRTTLSNAVREAARYGATDPTNSEGIIAAANQRSAGVQLAQDDDLIQSFADNKGVIRCTDRNYAWMPPLHADKLNVPLGLGLGVIVPALGQQLPPAASTECLSDFFFRVNGRLTEPPDQLPGSGLQGKTVKVEYTLSGTCVNVRTSLISYRTNIDAPNDRSKWILYDSALGGPYSGTINAALEITVPNDPNYGYKVEFLISGDVPPSPTPVPPTSTPTKTPTVTPSPTKTATPVPTATATATATPNVPATQTAGAKATQTVVAGQTATSVTQKTATAASGTSTAAAGQTATAAGTATAIANKTATSVVGTSTAVAGTTTAVANQTATAVSKTQTAVAPTPTKTATPNVPKTQTASANMTATQVSKSKTSVAKTATAVVNKTNTAVAGATNTVVAKTATAANNQTATAYANQTQTAVVGTSTAVAATTTSIAKTGTVAAQTATSVAGTSIAGTAIATSQTATSVSLTATANAPTSTPIPTSTVVGGLEEGVSFENKRDASGRIIPQDCEYPRVGNLLTVCASYDFYLAVPSLIGRGVIPMRECATVDIQSVPGE
jgi:hypothetical protein